ncbi:MAG: molybdopterin-binding protein, partial [Smithellaceae bacterium]
MKVTVITISDRASKGLYEDLSGPVIEKIIKENIADVEISRMIVPDEKEEIREALQKAASSDFI